jgi:chorismate mutase/prephenate dehydratase
MGKFGASVEYESLSSIRAVFEEMARGHVDYGVVPVENSTGGAVMDTLDAFVDSDVHVCCEIQRAIRHNLLATCNQSEIEMIYSKPEAFSQCERWLAETGLADRISPAASTSKAAEMAAGQAFTAAIGSALAAKIYGLKVIAEGIQDNPRNTTRFFVLGGQTPKPTGNDRTSLMFVTANKPGALSNVLLVFSKAGVNMSMITSRPTAKADVEYNFFADIDGHADDAAVTGAIESARGHCRTLRVLGSYPKAAEVVG